MTLSYTISDANLSAAEGGAGLPSGVNTCGGMFCFFVLNVITVGVRSLFVFQMVYCDATV